MKRTRNVIIISVSIVLLAMSIGYSTFATQLKLNSSTTEIMGEWDVRIINIEATSVSEGCDEGTPKYTNTTMSFDSKLEKPGDSITYVITIKNEGTIDATLGTVVFLEQLNGSEAINFVTTDLKHELKAGDQTTFSVIAEYITTSTEVPSVKSKTLTGIVEYVQE